MHLAVVGLLILAVLGDRHYTVLLLHVTHEGVFQELDAESSHSGVAAGENRQNRILALHVVMLNVGGVTRSVVEVQHLLGHVVELGRLKDPLVVTIGALSDDLHLAGGPVGVYANKIVADEAVDVSRLVLLGVAVVLMEQRNQGGLLVQSPGAVLHVLVKVSLVGILEQILIEDGHVCTAVEGQHHSARDTEGDVVVGHHVGKALVPPGLLKVQVLGVAEVVEVVARELGGGAPAQLHHHVVVGVAAAYGGDDLVDGGFLMDDLDLHAQPLLNGLVALVDGILHGVARQLVVVHGVDADEGDLLALVVQIGGQLVGGDGVLTLLGRGGLGRDCGIVGIGGFAAGGQSGQQHEGGQKDGEGTLHSVHGGSPL